MTDQRFIIVSPARSGSTMLRIMLQRLPGVSCCGESYAKGIVRGSISKRGLDKMQQFELRNEDEQAFLKDIGFSRNECTGIKILYEQFFGPWAANFVYYLSRHPDIKIIHLSRRDMSARYFSDMLHLARALNRDVSEPTVIEFQGSAQDMIQDAHRIRATAKLVDAVLTNHALYHVDYEDLLASEQARAQLLSFLGFDALAPHFVVPEHIVNENRSLVELSIANKAELVAAFNALMTREPVDILA